MEPILFSCIVFRGFSPADSLAGRMACGSSSSSNWWRILMPSYYLKSPKLLAVLFIAFVCLAGVFWHRQILVRDHEFRGWKFHLGESSEEISTKKSGDKIKEHHSESDYPLVIQRREKIKEAMFHAWTSYEKYAWGKDELKPQSKRGTDSFCGLGATIVDSLDTLYIMGLNEQFQKAKEWVTQSLNFNKQCEVSVFETTIRVVGGLLSAYDLSGDNMFLDKAKDIADRLLPAWNTPSGIPYNRIDLASGRAHNSGWFWGFFSTGQSILAECGTEQLESIVLSQRTGDPTYQQKVENVINQLDKIFPDDGLLPIYLNPCTGHASHGRITFGCMGDK